MQAYIEDIFLQSKLNTKENYIVINFSGCDFKCTYCNKPHLIEFKKQHQQDIKKIKAQIREFAGMHTKTCSSRNLKILQIIKPKN